jgi:dTMP kinase
MPKSLLISFEGGEGSGKSTQIQLLKEKLEKDGHEVITLREPGGTKIGEEIRQVVLSPENKNISFTTEVFLFQAQRAQLYHEVILPALDQNKIILLDRSRDSSLIYQGIVRKFGKELIEDLNTLSTQDTFPTITFFLDVPVEMGLSRRAKTGTQNRLDLEQTDFHQQVRDAYLTVARSDQTGRWVIIDASKPIEEVSELIYSKIKKK